MCVTTGIATITGTQAFVYATRDESGQPRHVCGYQNSAHTMGANCMFLNFPGQDLRMVRGPETTTSLMQSITARLEELEYVPRMRGMDFSAKGFGVRVEEYGDYTVLLAQGPGDILGALEQVAISRRPIVTPELTAMVDFYQASFPNDSFVLACFNGTAKPKHPITVSYLPRNREHLTIPGLDGHDGRVPSIGQMIPRDFQVAFAIKHLTLPLNVTYSNEDRHADRQWWAPRTVCGFHDNRSRGPNQDYVLPWETLRRGLNGLDLAEHLI